MKFHYFRDKEKRVRAVVASATENIQPQEDQPQEDQPQEDQPQEDQPTPVFYGATIVSLEDLPVSDKSFGRSKATARCQQALNGSQATWKEYKRTDKEPNSYCNPAYILVINEFDKVGFFESIEEFKEALKTVHNLIGQL